MNAAEDFINLIQEVLDLPELLTAIIPALFEEKFITIQIPLLTDLLKVLGVNIEEKISFADFTNWTLGLGSWIVAYTTCNSSMSRFSDMFSPDSSSNLSLSSMNKRQENIFLFLPLICREFENLAWVARKTATESKKVQGYIQLMRILVKLTRVTSENVELLGWKCKELVADGQTLLCIVDIFRDAADWLCKISALYGFTRYWQIPPPKIGKAWIKETARANWWREAVNVFIGLIAAIAASATSKDKKFILNEIASDLGRSATFLTYSDFTYSIEDGCWIPVDPDPNDENPDWFTIKCGILAVLPIFDGLIKRLD